MPLLPSAASTVLGAQTLARGTTRTLPGYSMPSKLDVYVVGHFVHEGIGPNEGGSQRRHSLPWGLANTIR